MNGELSTRTRMAQAVARGWCSERNSNKVLDVDLANAITDEVTRVVEEVYIDALIWASASDDFASDGKARVGYEKTIRPLIGSER